MRAEDRLPEGDILRPGDLRDGLALNRLVATSPWTFWGESWGAGYEDPDTLLGRYPGLLWLREEAIQGALFFSLYRQPVAEVCFLVLRPDNHQGDTNRRLFFSQVLPYAEAWLWTLGARWASVMDGTEWLLAELARYGYRFQDRVLGYRRMGLDLSIQPNRAALVRRISPDDIASVVALDATAFAPFWRVNDDMVRQASEKSPYALVAEMEQRVVGYLLAERSLDEGYISRLAVLPGHQGRGLGTRLVREAFSQMQRDGLNSVSLNTQENNTRSRNLYEHLGFQHIGASKVIWSKPLAISQKCKVTETS